MASKPNKKLFSQNKAGKGKVAFITGGGGRVGRALSIALLKKGYEVRALSHEKDFVYTMPAGIVPYVGDLTNKRILNEACDGADLVFHLAAVVSQYKASLQKLMEVNVQGTQNMLEACSKNGIGRLIFTSTVDVYGHSRKEVLTEESKLKPSDKYGYSKVLAEKKIEKYAGRLDYTILRMSAIYGKGFENSYFKLFRAIKDGKAYVIGDGKNHLSIIHVDDAIRGIISAAESGKGSNGIYNLSDGVRYTQEELFDLVADMLEVDRPKKHISPIAVRFVAKSRGLDSDELRFLMSNRLVDISRIKREVGFVPKVKIKDAGMDLVGDFLNSRN